MPTIRSLALAAILLLPLPVVSAFAQDAQQAAPAAPDVDQAQNEADKGWLTRLVEDRLSTPERQIRLSNIDGALGSDVSIREITISDAEGVWLRVNNARLTWNQSALLLGRLDVQQLAADSIEFLRNAVPSDQVDLPAPEAASFEVPEFPVAVVLQQLSVPRVTFGEDVFGLGSEISIAGNLTLQNGSLDTSLDIVRLDGPGGTLDLDVAYSNESGAIDLGLLLEEPENGVLANLLQIENRPAVRLSLTGVGPIADLEARLELAANGQTALSGTARIAQAADGYSIATDLRGPLATLIAEPYRAFFGAETALSADALVRSEGGVSITGLRVSGGQLSLDGALETTADNFLSTLALNAVIADSNGAAVTLPVPGAGTTVKSAQLAIAFGGAGGADWTSMFTIDGFATDGFAADTISLNIGGVADNLDDAASRRVTFNGDGVVSGIAAAPDVEAALGQAVRIGAAGLWTAGEPVQLAEFRVVGDALTAVLAGTLDGLDFDGTIGLETASIAPFSGLAGRDLDGALSLQAQGRLQPLSGGFDLTLDGTGTNLEVGDAVADRLLAGTVSLDGRVARTEAGITADGFRLTNPQVQLTADGTYSTTFSNFGFDLALSDLALLTDEASGALSVTGTARTGEDGATVLDLSASVPDGSLVGRTLREAQLGFAGTLRDGTTAGTINGSAFLDGNRVDLASDVSLTAETQTLSDIGFTVAGTRITGGFVRNATSGLVDGGLDIAAPDVSLAAALLLLDAQGAINAELRLAPDGEQQTAQVRGDVTAFVANDVRVGAAEFSASIDDLFGVPQIDGTAEASAVSAAGVAINTLNATASQSGTSTSFAAQARLQTGTGVDLAGSLTPENDGFRLALDRLALAQGTLTARLAQPTALLVAGNSVALDGVRFDVGAGQITASGTAGDTLAVTVDVSALPLSIANTVVPSLGLAGTLNGRATITGAATDPQVQFEASAAGVDAAAIASYGVTPLAVEAAGSYGNGTVRLAAAQARGAGGLQLNGSGTVPLSGGGLDLQLTGSAPLALANRFVADRGGQLSGTVTLDAQIGGSLTAPSFGGRVATSNAGYVDPELNLRLVGITGSASLSGTSLSINSLTAGLATGGSVSASGTVGLTGAFPANITLSLNDARYADGNLFVATVRGGLTLTGNLTANPLLAGTVFIDNANISVPETFAGGAQLIDVDHVRTPAPVARTLERARIDQVSGAPVPQTRPAGLLLDVTLNAPNQVFIRGRGLDAEVGGSVRLTGPVNNVQPVGGLDLIRGRLEILGQRVVFESGTVTLVGDLDPFLNLVARTQGDDITVFVTVAGRVSDIDVSFTSSPSLPQDEVLSRLIFKRSMGELSPLQLARLAGAAAELVGGGGGGGLVDGLRGAAGLADLDVVTDAQGNVGVSAGTYLQDNVYVGVTAGANGQSRVTINLDVTDDLKVQGAAGQDGNSSLGVFYEQDY